MRAPNQGEINTEITKGNDFYRRNGIGIQRKIKNMLEYIF